MIKFRQKEFSEYDAMRSLYVELMKRSDRTKFSIIDLNSLIPILKGNNIVIEKFVISTSLFGKDKYRMFIKVGAKAKMPDEVRLPGKVYDKRLGNLSINFEGGIFRQDNNSNNNSNSSNSSNNSNNSNNLSTKKYSFIKKEQRSYGDKPMIGFKYEPNINITQTVNKLLGEAIKYDKKERSLVLEFESIDDAIQALNILPFGLGYKIYLLDNN